jgi:hypothetical protein
LNQSKNEENRNLKNKRRTKLIAGIKMLIIASALLIFNILNFINIANAESINVANIYSIGDCGNLLTYKGGTVKVSYVQYIQDGVEYPAYCMDKTKPGAETTPYTVSIQNAIQDVGLWRRIVNGYPYKTIQELGVVNKEEAFTATKQAIYCYIHGNNPDDYGAIGEAGERTLNAMKKIISDAQNSSEIKISSTLTINKNDDEWKQDENEKNYLSKTYTISAGSTIEKYKITLTKENSQDLGGLKLTDTSNQERTEFSPNEKFKILIPIKNMTEAGSFNIQVEAKVKTKPVLYGTAPNSEYQDYALTAATYEDGIGRAQDEYAKNETKIIIIKKDQEEEIVLEGVEFELLNEKKETVYTGLKTNSEGKIVLENLIPGVYYLRETKAIDGYQANDEDIKLKIELNEEIMITVNNIKEEKPKVETTKTSSKEVKRLPVTGM